MQTSCLYSYPQPRAEAGEVVFILKTLFYEGFKNTIPKTLYRDYAPDQVGIETVTTPPQVGS